MELGRFAVESDRHAESAGLDYQDLSKPAFRMVRRGEPGQIETVWILDLDGTVVAIYTELKPGPAATAHADFNDAVPDSIRDVHTARDLPIGVAPLLGRTTSAQDYRSQVTER